MYPGDGGGGGVTQQHTLPTRSQGIEGYTPTSQRYPPACSQGTKEGGALPDQQRALLAHGLQDMEGVRPPGQEGYSRAPSEKQRALLTHGLREREEGGPPDQ